MINNDAELLAHFLNTNPEIELVEVILPDVNGSLRGKWITREKISKILDGGIKLPLSTLAFDMWGRDPSAWVFETGDGDGICVGEL